MLLLRAISNKIVMQRIRLMTVILYAPAGAYNNTIININYDL